MKRPALGHVLGYTALTIVLSAGAAQGLAGSNTVTGGDIVNGTVSYVDIKDGAVGSKKILDGSVSYEDIKDGAVGSKKILDESIRSQDVHDERLQSEDIKDGEVANSDLATDAVTSGKVDNNSLRVQDVASFDFVDDVDLDPLAAGACDTFSIPIASSLDDPVVLLNPPANFFSTPGLVFNWNVGINNLDPVDVHVCNVSANQIDAPSGGWRVTGFAG